MSKNQPPRAFLAHNSQDKPQVKIIAEKLKQKGIDTWLDEEQIPPGVSFQDRIQKAISEIDCALIFIGKHGLGKWQGWELQSFFSKLVNSGIPVIPVLLPGVEKVPDDLPFLQQLNWVKFTDKLEDPSVINKLVWGITGKSAYTDYSVLETRLAAGKWREANTETRRIILQSANREKDGYLFEEEIRNFDSEILLTLDRLWLKYSNNRFGFSIQKKMLIDSDRDINQYAVKVGWRVSDDWINQARVIYNLNAPVGHLPYGMLGIVELNNAILDGFVNAQFKITKAVATQDWQKQLIADSVGVFELLSGNKNFNSKEFKEGLDYQFSHEEGWWQGERAEQRKIQDLCLLLFSCKELLPQTQQGVEARSNNNYRDEMPDEFTNSSQNSSETHKKRDRNSSVHQKRLDKEQETLQLEWDIRIEKLSLLRRSLAIETSPSIKFQLEQQIQDETKIIERLNQRLEEIDLALDNG
jgi:GUN4-like/TIR domain